MPTEIHEFFLEDVIEKIKSRLRELANTDSRSKAFVQNVRSGGSPILILKGKNNNDNQAIIKREPDATFYHRGIRWPCVIIEVSYSQKTKALRHLADDYILETNGSVRVVIGLDVDYKTRKGSISMWRPGYVENKQGELELEATQTLYNQVRRFLIEYQAIADIDQVFSDGSGGPNLSPDAGLRLELKDFGLGDVTEGISGSFLINSAILRKFLNEAVEKWQNVKQQKEVAIDHLPLGMKKRRWESSSSEEIDSDEYCDEPACLP